ncbi:hypothetical protein L9F63_000081 [Diploptera punctata]|uniref:Origin recognition complex subunit 1 n=1 Tax=Diploptera punctata TaxID=6984 RepID=A0AAD8AMD9_DIPPU|nr:hypothetical protein L9F63_000081 [Diploptera punctata]
MRNTRNNPLVEWKGSAISTNYYDYCKRTYYREFAFGRIHGKIGDFVLISNADSADPDTVEGCDVAEILKLFEAKGDDPYKAKVKWYSRPNGLPKKFASSKELYQNLEVIQDNRSFDDIVSIETFFSLCQVVGIDMNEDPAEVMKSLELPTNFPVYVCRYKLVYAAKRVFKLEPYLKMNDTSSSPRIKTVKDTSSSPRIKTKASQEIPSSPRLKALKEKVLRNKKLEQGVKNLGNDDGNDVDEKEERLNNKKNSPSFDIQITTSLYEPQQSLTLDPRERNPVVLNREISGATRLWGGAPSCWKTMLGCSFFSAKKNDPHIMPSGSAPRRSSILEHHGFETWIRNLAYEVVCHFIFNIYEKTPSSKRNKSEIISPTKSSQRLRRPNKKSSSKKDLYGNTSPRTPKSVSKLKTSETSSKKKSSSVRLAHLTPSVPERSTSLSTPNSALQEARARLHVSAVPKSLPCREKEFDNIYYFLLGKILDGTGGCMYISGVPGTGKTATVQEVVRTLQNATSQGEIPEFQFVELNGMRLTEPRQAYVQLLKQLTGRTVVAEQAQQLLERRFTHTGPRRITTLLLVDELDLLWTRRQDVVYNLLDWPTKSSSRLVVLTIANTMNLPERLLMGRVTSRLGLTRVTFHPYTHKQLEEIVLARLEGMKVFDPDAVQLVARKVAAVSGDARRALDICRRATELAENDDSEGMVEMKHVDQALLEMVASTKVQAIRYCSKIEQLFLSAVAAEVQRTGVEETSFHKVYMQLRSLCTFDGYALPSITEALGVCSPSWQLSSTFN